MSEVDDQLKRLVVEACQHPPGSLLRQRYLTRIIRLITQSRKLWRENSQYYQDALQLTWIYFCQNLCESTTTDRFDPERASVTTWLNAYLKRRLQDGYLNEQKQRATQTSTVTRRARTGESGETIDLVETLPATPEPPPILESVHSWVQRDPTGELSQIHISGHAQITAQVLILRRLPPESPWNELAEEFGISISTLSSFYRRQCLPRLRKFGESEGYL